MKVITLNPSSKPNQEYKQNHSIHPLKNLIISTILIYFLANNLNIMLIMIRDNFIKEICWSPKPECTCKFSLIWFYIFFEVYLEDIVGISYGCMFMFSLQQKKLMLFRTKIFIFLFYTVVIVSSYVYGYFNMKSSPRAITYSLGFIFEITYVLCYLKPQLKLNFKEFFKKIKYQYYFSNHVFIYFGVNVYILPYIYSYMKQAYPKQGQNIFQIFMFFLTILFEKSYFYLMSQFSYLLTIHDDLKDYSFLIIACRYYYVMFYSLRLGNMLYLEFNDWGIYVQFLSFMLFIYEFNSGVSLFAKIIKIPMGKFFSKTTLAFKMSMNFTQINENSKNSNVNPTSSSMRIKQTIIKKTHVKAFQNKIKNPALTFSRKKLVILLFYQKLEFLLIYIPSILYLWRQKVWKTAEPISDLTVGCTFEITNLTFQGETIISFIVIDMLSSLFLFWSFCYKKKWKFLYETEKFNFLTRLLIYMSFQIIFERWVSHFSTLQLDRGISISGS